MMESLRAWLLSLAGVALLTALASLFPTSESLRRVTKLAGGVALTCLLFSPLVTFDYDAYAAALQDYHVSVSTDGAVSDSSERLQRTVIESEMRTYILDKASSLGMQISVELEMETRAATPYPSGVTIRGAATPTQKQQLQTYLEQTFAIAPERQVWLP